MKHKHSEVNEKTESLSVYVSDRARVRAVAGARGQLPAIVIREALSHWVAAQPAHIKAVADSAIVEQKLAADLTSNKAALEASR
jgi:hypothetical protein